MKEGRTEGLPKRYMLNGYYTVIDQIIVPGFVRTVAFQLSIAGISLTAFQIYQSKLTLYTSDARLSHDAATDAIRGLSS